jgi:hypothetical protein
MKMGAVLEQADPEAKSPPGPKATCLKVSTRRVREQAKVRFRDLLLPGEMNQDPVKASRSGFFNTIDPKRTSHCKVEGH